MTERTDALWPIGEWVDRIEADPNEGSLFVWSATADSTAQLTRDFDALEAANPSLAHSFRPTVVRLVREMGEHHEERRANTYARTDITQLCKGLRLYHHLIDLGMTERRCPTCDEPYLTHPEALPHYKCCACQRTRRN